MLIFCFIYFVLIYTLFLYLVQNLDNIWLCLYDVVNSLLSWMGVLSYDFWSTKYKKEEYLRNASDCVYEGFVLTEKKDWAIEKDSLDFDAFYQFSVDDFFHIVLAGITWCMWIELSSQTYFLFEFHYLEQWLWFFMKCVYVVYLDKLKSICL